jgi:hypothetical protein
MVPRARAVAIFTIRKKSRWFFVESSIAALKYHKKGAEHSGNPTGKECRGSPNAIYRSVVTFSVAILTGLLHPWPALCQTTRPTSSS